ncbi:MAG: hypothetical protein ACFFCS_11425 [Candidatus Hodarchaeota archaeon]
MVQTNFVGNQEMEKEQIVRKRIKTIDYMRSISMFFVFYCHFAVNWRGEGWVSWIRLQWTALDFLGITSFIGLSILGSLMSHFSRMEKGDNRLITKKIILRASFFFILGEIYNLIGIGYMGVFHFFGANIFYTLTIFSLLLSFFMRLDYRIKLVIVAIITFTYYPLLNWAWGGLQAAGISPEAIQIEHMQDPRILVYYMILDHRAMSPLYPWLVLPLLITIVFGRIMKVFKTAHKEELHKETKKILLVGIALVVINMITGYQLTQGYIVHDFLELIQPGFFITWPLKEGLPLFWVRNSIRMILYNFGWFCIIFYVISWIQFVKERKFPWEDKMMAFGNLSITGFFLSLIAYTVKLRLPWPIFYAIFIPIFIIIVNTFYYWTVKYKAKFSLEWLLVVYTTIISNLGKGKKKKGD